MKNVEPLVDCRRSIEQLEKHFTAIRMVFGVSQEELAAILGITRMSIHNLETGKTKMSPLYYFAIRLALELFAYGIMDTDYYIDIWYRLVEGMTIDCEYVSDEESDQLASRILDISKSVSKKLGMKEIAFTIKKELVSGLR